MGKSVQVVVYWIKLFHLANNMFSDHVLSQDDQGTTDSRWKLNCQWINKQLPTKKIEIHQTLEWCEDNFSNTYLTVNHGMLPFLLPMGNTNPVDSSNPKENALRLQYGYVNHNQINPNVALEIANNLAGNPMKYQSGHDRVMDKDFELVFYQSNEVRFVCLFYYHQ